MTKEDITKTLSETITRTIIGDWRHEGKVDQVYTDDIECMIDGKHYTITVICHEDDEE